MRVELDYICEHEFPQPWVSCLECMLKPPDKRPEPPAPPPPPRKVRPGQLPKTADDPLPPLLGDKDVSVAVWDFDEHMNGAGNDWLFADSGFPGDLRPGGWIYLRHDGRLGAKVRVKGIGFRNVRVEHTGDDGSRDDREAGPTIEVDASTWESVDIDLGDLAENQRQGYRYLITSVEGDVKHLTSRDSIPDSIEVDPLAQPSATPGAD